MWAQPGVVGNETRTFAVAEMLAVRPHNLRALPVHGPCAEGCASSPSSTNRLGAVLGLALNVIFSADFTKRAIAISSVSEIEFVFNFISSLMAE